MREMSGWANTESRVVRSVWAIALTSTPRWFPGEEIVECGDGEILFAGCELRELLLACADPS